MIGKLLRFFSSIGRFLFVLFILVGAFVFAMFQGGLVSWTIFYTVLPFTVYSILLFFYPLASFRARRTLQSTHLQKGDPLKVTVYLHRKFRFPLLYTAFSDRWMDEGRQKPIGEVHKLFIFGWKRQEKWQYALKDMPRGQFIAKGIRIEVTDFFGWIRKSKVIPIYDETLVYPELVDVDFMPIEADYGGRQVTSPFNLIKDTTMITGVRDYQSGDRVSWIHWKSFARTGTLMTKEFEDQGSDEVTLIFDGRASKIFEDEIVFAASILKEAVNERLPIRFLPVSRQESFPIVQSETEFNMILLELAKMQAVDEKQVVLSTAIRKELEESSSIVVISSHLDPQFLEAIRVKGGGRRSVICFIVIEHQRALRGILLENIKYAESIGLIVQPVMKQQFATAFKEVIKT